jgi:flagellar L-ring protein precursor FlgH
MLLAGFCGRPQAQSLYVAGADPYAARRRFEVGDLIQVSIDETISADRESQQAVSKQAAFNAGFNANAASGPGVAMQASLGTSGSGSGSTKKSDQLTGTITVRVEAIQPDGTLSVKGEHVVDLDGEDQRLTLSGLLRPEDVGLDRTASSQRMAQAELHLVNKGTAARGGTLGWLHWLFSWMGL